MAQKTQPEAVAAQDEPAPAESKEQVKDVKKPQKQAKPGAKKPVIIVAIVTAVVILAACIGGFMMQGGNQKKETYPVKVSLSVKANDANANVLAPLRVEGENSQGISQLERFVVTSNGDQAINLEKGTYTITIACNPMSTDGTLYTYEGCTCSVTVDGQDGAEVQIPGCEPVPAGQVTQDMVDEAARILTEYGCEDGNVKSGQDAAQKQADDAKKKQEEEAAQKAAEEAAAAETAAAAAAAAAAGYDTADGSYSVKMIWTDFKLGDQVIGGGGAYIEVDEDQGTMRVESKGNDGLSDGVHLFKLSDNCDIRFKESVSSSTIHALSNSLFVAYSKTGTGIGPSTASGKATAYYKGGSAPITWTVSGGVVTSVNAQL